MTEQLPADPRRPYRETARHYASHRYTVSDPFVRTLVARLALNRADRVLDLGAGPAMVARRLAPFVGQVVAVDPEPAMLEEGRRRCRAEGLENVTCIQGSSHDLTAVEGPFRVATIGMAFHWMTPHDALLRHLDELIDATRGAVVLVSPLGGPSPAPAWWTELDVLLQEYLAGTPDPGHPGGLERDVRPVLAASPFPELEELRHEYTAEERIDVEAALGFRYSLSWVLARLGARRSAYEAEAHRRFDARVGNPVRAVACVDLALIARRAAQGPAARPAGV